MLARILVDISAQCRPAAEAPNAGVLFEREIARRLLDDGSLNTLPIVFRTGNMYALDRMHAADLLRGDVPTESPPQIRPAPVEQPLPAVVSRTEPVAQSPSTTLASLRRRALRMALHGASVAARGVIRLAPERARADLTQSLRHARNAGVAILRPAQQRGDTLTLASPPEEPVASPPEPVAAPPEVMPSNYPRLSTMVHPTPRDIVWTCSLSIESIPLRRLAEAKLATGFRVASMCFGANRVRMSKRDTPERSASVLAARMIDQLDASDLIFCVLRDAQDDLHRIAAERGRPTPRVCLLPLDAEWARSAAIVKDGLLTLPED